MANLIAIGETMKLKIHFKKPLVNPSPAQQRLLQIGKILINDIKKFDILKQSSAMAYLTLLSIVPSLAVSFSLMTLFAPVVGDGQFFTKVKSHALSKLTEGTGQEVAEILDKFVENLDITSLGISGFLGLLLTLILQLRQIELVLNKIWMIDRNRNLFVRFVYFWTFLTLGTFLTSLAVGLLANKGMILNHMPAEEQSQWFINTTLGGLFFFFLFKLVPNCKVKAIPALCGAALSGLLFQLSGKGFAIYVNKFANYKMLYGALAALPLFLMWIYLCWFIILLGAILSWRIQQGFPQLANNSTEADFSPFKEQSFKRDRLQSLTPFFLLILINQHYLAAKRQGITGLDMHEQLKIPRKWIVNSIKLLTNLGYIIAAKELGSDSHNALESEYFPAIPPQKLFIEIIFSNIMEPVQSWIKEWQVKIDWDAEAILARFNTIDEKERKSLSLEEVLNSLK